MAYINNKKYQDILKAALSGDEKAKSIIISIREMKPQEEIDNLVKEFYDVAPKLEQELNSVKNAAEVNAEPETEKNEEPLENENAEEEKMEAEKETEIVNDSDVEVKSTKEEGEVKDIPLEDVSLNDTLDKELKDLIEEKNVEQMSFSDFLGKQRLNNLRAKKNIDYFKAYDEKGRHNFLESKINDYKGKYNTIFNDVERKYNDNNTALQLYINSVNEMPDGDVTEINPDEVAKVYNEFSENEDNMKAFGRYWDEKDNDSVKSVLADLVAKYGKNNVKSALNYLTEDNNNYRNYLNNQIDEEIVRYTKSLENLLK